MGKQIFKEGDDVYIYPFGKCKFQFYREHDFCVISDNSGKIHRVMTELISFAPYALQGFSQERPIVLPEENELVLVRNFEDESWTTAIFKGYDSRCEFPYLMKSDCNDSVFNSKYLQRIKLI